MPYSISRKELGWRCTIGLLWTTFGIRLVITGGGNSVNEIGHSQRRKRVAWQLPDV
ncbi:hypothetical protein [Dyadobacter helix]|uniref:hypothetical protein n=1 Tax=Dyadobacter helix TaxID=2822344 RepID=UPI001BFC04D7|nr:hypothetical protein [Dyadobacter sp. CECT 9275]